jgi:hypothetical protein
MDTEWNPYENHEMISLELQEDGNWRGWTWRFGRVIGFRDYSPEAVLQRLLTSDGKEDDEPPIVRKS